MTARIRILVACEELVLSGGMLRFERLGRALPADVYEFAYVCLADRPVAHWPSRFPVLNFRECSAQSWNFVMVPGAGFRDPIIDRLAGFCAPGFGRRIQHVLNDRSSKPRFLRVNRALRPHVVVFNNLAWPPGSYAEFQAEQFHTVLGAVDIHCFYPAGGHAPEHGRAIVLGGLANKNAEVLVDALALLPDNTRLRLLGSADDLLDARPGVRHMPRIELVGVILEGELPGFYHSLDIAVHTEMRGGWSNFAAEAMASGLPLICTSNGTGPFARDGVTALVLREISAPGVAAAVERIANDQALATELAFNGADAMQEFSWQAYANALEKVLGLKE